MSQNVLKYFKSLRTALSGNIWSQTGIPDEHKTESAWYHACVRTDLLTGGCWELTLEIVVRREPSRSTDAAEVKVAGCVMNRTDHLVNRWWGQGGQIGCNVDKSGSFNTKWPVNVSVRSV